MKLFKQLARSVAAYQYCIVEGNTEWQGRHEETINELVRNYFPHGSGFDSGTKLDLAASSGDKLVFNTSFHHMNENGSYDGWTEHRITVTPSLSSDHRLNISGRDRNQIKEYIAECFNTALDQEIAYENQT